MKKMCAICRKAKEEEEFRIKRQKINGKVYTYRHSYCRECEKVVHETISPGIHARIPEKEKRK